MSRKKVTFKKRPITSWDKAPLIMDTEEAAILLGVYPDTLRLMARRGDVPAIKIGPKLWKFEKSALMAKVRVKELYDVD